MFTDLGHVVIHVLLLLPWDFVQPPLCTFIGQITVATTQNAQPFANVSQQSCNVGALVRCANTLQPPTTNLMPGEGRKGEERERGRKDRLGEGRGEEGECRGGRKEEERGGKGIEMKTFKVCCHVRSRCLKCI